MFVSMMSNGWNHLSLWELWSILRVAVTLRSADAASWLVQQWRALTVEVTYNDWDQASSVEGLHTPDNALQVWMLGSQQGGPTANWCTLVSMKNPWHSLAWFYQKCWRSSYDQSATTLIHRQVSSSFFLWTSCENGWECRYQPSHYWADSWRRLPGWPRTTWMKTIQGDLSSLDLELHDATELAQNGPLWRLMSLYSVTHS